ncbi:DUF2255 family protein [Chryseobacterium binzhouense]|uniref:DUF2255 family protein n=1 Tax=Chryseobacterium binzhouense TaxID=2593646 RepID=UPI00289D6E0F|nr:DUF2255 family protein [Chryseobacterium binzhouense]
MTKDEIIQKISNTRVCQIKVGETHGFRDIWVVVAEGRLFCRQYSFSKNNWRNALLENEKAYLKVDGNIVKISGKIPEDLDTIMQKVNEAYIEKYVHRLNYYPEIAQQAANLEKHQKSTVELQLK